jgi:hypothetical protein
MTTEAVTTDLRVWVVETFTANEWRPFLCAIHRRGAWGLMAQARMKWRDAKFRTVSYARNVT